MNNQELLEKLTLAEKAALVSGKNTWETSDAHGKLPSMWLADGPHGLRKQEGKGDQLGLHASRLATCFPTAATLANSWDPDVLEIVGKAIGVEAFASGVNAVLGPGINIKRNPRCGRNFEYFSEDPYLAGKLAAGIIRGIQANGTVACPKHFAANNQEYRRMASNSVVDERTYRELYTTNFEIAVKEGHPRMIMSSYNMINGTYANENAHNLKSILRNEWRFNGFVVTDWGGDNDHVAGIKNGGNVVMPSLGKMGTREIINAVKEGTLSEDELDQCCDQILDVVVHSTAAKSSKETLVDWNHQHTIARQAAEESIVLLKNTDHILPLIAGTNVAVIGDFAKTPRYQGAGSSVVNVKNLENMVDTFPLKKQLDFIGYAQGYRRTGKHDQQLIDEAVNLAQKADVAVVCVGLTEIAESEGLDRKNIKMPANQLELLDQLLATKTPVVVVLAAGSPLSMPWFDRAAAVVHGYLGGEAGASAMWNVLTGDVNPSGHLAETYPFSADDVPFNTDYPETKRDVLYLEGPFVGYRYFDTAMKKVQFPFGYGLSYTTFSYDDLIVHDDGVTFSITNTGKYAGATVAQLYVGKKDSSLIRPQKELRGFKKVLLQPGETRQVTLPFDDKTFRYYDVEQDKWQVEAGTYQLMVGENVAAIQLTGTITRQGVLPQKRLAPAFDKYRKAQVAAITPKDFEVVYGKKLPVELDLPDKKGMTLKQTNILAEMRYARSWIGRCVAGILRRALRRSEAKGQPNLNLLFNYNMPFRAISKMTGGMITTEMVNNILMIVNGHFWRGSWLFVRNFLRNQRATLPDDKAE
ncbi:MULTISPECIES: glycoside hydrolase family 3 C-terminal domain-containing protein [unclassified Ligilactobacillus]|uniref:glycoside hydrolase family 3 C-terminal domain-containing protein n=1 Tax=unclassified Ligilactobacillus TaxID=2767920 RepID=UPI003852959D